MWTSLAFAALALAPAQAPAGGALNLSNIRLTYGQLGGTRPEGKLLPGDIMFVGFDIEGLTLKPDGTTSYSMGLEVTDKAGKTIFKQEPADKEDFVPLGGTKIPGRAYILAGYDQEPGTYNFKVTVTDKATKASKSLDKKFDVAERGFGVVAVHTTVDERGEIPAPTTGIVGQAVFVQFVVIGFQRAAPKEPKPKDPKDPKAPTGPQPNVLVEMHILDETGRATLAKPPTVTVEGGLDEKDPGFTLRFLLPMTRTGKFTVRLKATDNLAKKTATFDLPLASDMMAVPSAAFPREPRHEFAA